MTILLLATAVTYSSGQTWNEWFKQKKTQQKYLIEQIAALEVYLGYVRDGYDIVKDGTDLIADITWGEFGLHKDYFGSLKIASPRVGQQDRVSDIVAMHGHMLHTYPKILKQSAGALTPEEIDHVAAVYRGLMKAAAADLEELLLVITDGRVEMTEDERLRRIDTIYGRSLKKKVFFTRLSLQVLALVRRRTAGARESELFWELHGGEKEK